MVDNGMSAEQREIAELKARLSALKSNNSSKKQFNFNKDKVKGFFSKNKKLIIILSILTVFVVAIMTTCISFLGIRGVYVNENDPYESYSFTATAYEKRDKSYEGDMYVDKGTWSRSGNKLTISYKDEWFGKVKEEYNVIVGNKNNSLTIISGEDEDTFKRVSKVSWNLSKNKKIDVTFDLNGGIASEEIRNIEVKFGESFEYKLPTPTRDDATFKGWYTTVDGFKNNGKVYVDGKPVYEDVTYYANWFLHSDCPGHEYNSRCVCTICGKTADVYDKEVHLFNESCICTKCGLDEHAIIGCGVCSLCQQQMHNVDINCKCIICGAEAHQYDEWYQCEKCSYINTDEVTNNLRLYLSIEGDEITITDSRDDVTNVIIPNYVTSIGNSAFRYCDSITSVTIGDSVTSIGSSAFLGCRSLTSVNYLGTIEQWCGITFGHYDSNPLYYAKNLYLNGELVTELVIPNTVTKINNYAFYNCSSLTSVVIGDSVMSIGSSAFSGCTNLTSVVIPDSVTSIEGYAFCDCKSLTSVNYLGTIEQWCGITFGTHDSNPIYYANKLYINGELVTELVIPNTVTKINNYAFRYCSSLTSVVIGNSVTSIGSSAFSGCTNLTSVVIPDSVTSIEGYAFYDCRSLTSVNYLGTIEQWCGITFGHDANPVFYAKKLYLNGELVTDLVIPNTVTKINDYAFSGYDSLTSVLIGNSVTSIGNASFLGCSSLTSVVIGNSVTSIGSSAFSSCSSLTSVVIPDSVTSMENYAFYNCSSLTSVVIGDSVTSIGEEAFYRCSSLTSVVIGDSVTSIGEGAFDGCGSLTSVVIPDSVTSIEGAAFRYCSSLESVVIPDSVTSIEWYAFRDCKSLTSVVIPDSVTSIGEEAFYGCRSLTSIVIPDLVTSIGRSAFYNCNSLTSVTIGNSVTSIGNAAFYNCRSLTSVVIPSSVTSIGYNAFGCCYSLTSITFEDPSTWYSTTSSSNWENKTGGTQTNVSTPTNNDEIFVDNYYNYYWYKL